MAEPLGNLTRTHTCGALRADEVGADVVLLGWVHRVRDLGGVTFIDIRDRAGVSQVVVRENDTLMPIAKKLRSEFVIGVSGVVQRRCRRRTRTGRQAEIEQHQVEALARKRRVRGTRIADPVDRVAFEAQCAAQALADHAIVFHQQQAHRRFVMSIIAVQRRTRPRKGYAVQAGIVATLIPLTLLR